MSQAILTTEIIKLSEAKFWDGAKLEWKVYLIEKADEPQTCLCGHSPIIEICHIRNKVNGIIVEVGNCCVKKFLGLPSDKIFAVIKRIEKDETTSLNAETIEYAHGKDYINQWEKDFSLKTMRKRSLSDAQLITRVKINRKILSKYKRG